MGTTTFEVCSGGYGLAYCSWETGVIYPKALTPPWPQHDQRGWAEGFVLSAKSDRVEVGGTLRELREYFRKPRLSDADLLEAVSRFGLPFQGAHRLVDVKGLPANPVGELRHQIYQYQKIRWLVDSLMRGGDALIKRTRVRSGKTRLPLLPRLRCPGVDRYAADFGVEVAERTFSEKEAGEAIDAFWRLIIATINTSLELYARTLRLDFREGREDPRQRISFREPGASFLEVLWLELARKISGLSPSTCACGETIWAASAAKRQCQRCTQQQYDKRRAPARKREQNGETRR